MKLKKEITMKNIHWKKAFNGFLILTILLMASQTFAQIKKEKRVEKSFSGKKIVKIFHNNGPINIMKSKGNETKLEVVMSLEAKTEADAQIALNNFNVDIDDIGDRLNVETSTGVENMINKNGVSRITYKSGEKVKDVRNLKATFTIYVPTLQELYVSNKYDEVNIEDGITSDLELKLYSGRIDAGSISGDLTLDLKYSKGQIGNFKEGDFDLYDSNIELGTGTKVELESKYSEIEIGDVESLEMDVYDDKIETGDISGNLIITDKYSDLKIGNFGNARMDLYDSNITLKNGNDLQVKSKYTEFRINQLKSLNFDLSYDDDIRIESLGSLVTDSKYTEYRVGTLKSSVTMETYDDELDVDRFTGPLEGIEIEGKYTEVELNLPSDTSFRLEAEITYGKVTYNKDGFELQQENISSNLIHLIGKSKNATDSSPLIKLEVYDCDIEIN